jgi:RNA recognition motif-containing protein
MNLPLEATNKSLKDAFSPFGTVLACQVRFVVTDLSDSQGQVFVNQADGTH